MSSVRVVVLALLLAAEPNVPASEAHLVAGAEAFRAESYEKALVEFRSPYRSDKDKFDADAYGGALKAATPK